MAGPLGPSIVGFFAAMSCFGALLLGTMGGKAFLEGSESYFWLIFRCHGSENHQKTIKKQLKNHCKPEKKQLKTIEHH